MTTKEQIAVMQAYEAGKQIEAKSKTNLNDYWEELFLPSWNWEKYDFRVKQEKKYRPYENTEEMINDFCERFGVKRTSYGEPFIWLKDNCNKRLIILITEDSVYFSSTPYNMNELLKHYTYLDGSPCGKIEE